MNIFVTVISLTLQLLLVTFSKTREQVFSWGFILILYLVFIILFAAAVYFSISSILVRSYELKKSGITVYRLGKFLQHYRWEEFQTIRVATIKMRVCDYRRCLILSKRLLPYPLTKPNYSWFEKHPFSTLLFEFTPERYVEFREKFPDIKLEWEDANGSE